MTDDKAQILLLSALAACACLIALAVCLQSINTSYEAGRPALRRETIDNVLWVQDAALLQAAGETGCCQWEHRAALADSYKAQAYIAVSSIERSMMARGVAYSFSFNGSLTDSFPDDSGMSEFEFLDGILVKKEDNNASVCGCAYDMALTDGSSRYHISTVKIWD